MREQIEVLVKLQQIETETVQIKSALNDVSKRLEDLDAERFAKSTGIPMDMSRNFADL